MPTVPTEIELRAALVNIKSKNQALGISKIHAVLVSSFPDWAVSEKRTRKVLQQEGLVISNSSGKIGENEVSVYPSSRIIPDLDVTKWSTKVTVKYFDKKKGKGLVATTDIGNNEIIWKEEPFIIAPEWEILEMQKRSAACCYCTTPLGDSPLITACSASSSSSFCPAQFCNRLCQARSAKIHPLLCPFQNPASVPLLNFIWDTRWMALHALTQCTSRLLLSNQQNEATFNADWDFIQSFAQLGMEERHKHSFKLSGISEPDRASWKKAYQLFVKAFRNPDHPNLKKLSRLLKKPLPPQIDQTIFDYDVGFLHGLGKMSLNLEAHGGLYILHSHLNHSCQPNVSVRHLDTRNALSRITLVAKSDVKAGEELCVSYVNPKLGYTARQNELRAWGFGCCRCERCINEAEKVPSFGEGEAEMDDLASELKAGLGVM